MKRIVFTGDVFRTKSGEAAQLQNAFLLHELMGFPIWRATGIFPETRFCGVGPSEIRDWPASAYEDFGLEPTLEGWSRLFWRDQIPDRLLRAFAHEYADAIVVCFEMPPIMEAIFEQLQVPWINVCLSPLRFLPDLLLDFSLSKAFASGAIDEFKVSQDLINFSTDRIRKWAAQTIKQQAYNDSVVFFAQTGDDRTLIKADGFIQDDEVIERVRTSLVGRRLFLKPHPWGDSNPLNRQLTAEFGAEACQDNSYAMIASPDDFEVMTISSSVSREAPHFGKAVDIIYPDVIDRQLGSCGIMGHYRFAKFWRSIFEPVLETTVEDDFRMIWHHNLLRARIGTISLPMDVWANG